MKYSNLSVGLESLKPGDIIGCSGANFGSDIINLGSYGLPRWSISHVMIVGEDGNDLLLFESTTDCDIPCALRGVTYNGTQAHYPYHRLALYRGKVWHYPLLQPLRAYERRELSKYLISTVGRPYDSIGAERSGLKIWSHINAKLHQENTAKLFCSEWVASALREIERFDTLSVSKWSPNALVREAQRRGIVGYPRRLK